MSDKVLLFTSPKLRVIVLSLGVSLTAVVVTAGLSVYLPVSLADKIGLPVLLFPLIWLSLFFLTCFCQSIWRAIGMLSVLTMLHVVVVYFSLQAG
jgi:hypothetical protein